MNLWLQSQDKSYQSYVSGLFVGVLNCVDIEVDFTRSQQDPIMVRYWKIPSPSQYKLLRNQDGKRPDQPDKDIKLPTNR